MPFYKSSRPATAAVLSSGVWGGGRTAFLPLQLGLRTVARCSPEAPQSGMRAEPGLKEEAQRGERYEVSLGQASHGLSPGVSLNTLQGVQRLT